MKTAKRYLLALAGFIATGAAVGVLGDLLTPLFVSTPARIPLEDIETWKQQTMLRLNALSALNNLLAFGVAAFLFRKNPLLPGLILYVAIAIPTIYILHSIAVPADPSITYLDILADNAVGWIASVLAALAGMGAGHLLARRRDSYAYAT